MAARFQHGGPAIFSVDSRSAPAWILAQLLCGFQPASAQYLQDGLVLIAQLLKSVIGDPCINGKLADPIDCSVSDVSNFGKPNQAEKVLPQCDTGLTNKPCWHVIKDPVACPVQADGSNPDSYVLKIERNETAPPDTHVISYCVTEVQ